MRYFFDFHDGDQAQIDDEGTELVDMQAARDEATETLLTVAREALPPNGQARSLSVRVRDPNGVHMLTITLGYSEEPPEWVR